MVEKDFKIIVTGPMGAGKTTLIKTVSDIEVLSTEQINSERDICDKETTTVAMDYGEVSIGESERLLLYGTPGQERFDFMWESLSDGAVGILVLINDATDGESQFARYLKKLSAYVDIVPIVIGVSRLRAPSDLAAYHAKCVQLGIILPVLAADPRDRIDITMLLEVLFAQIEARFLAQTR